MSQIFPRYDKDAEICGNCRYYGFEVPDNTAVYAWSFCKFYGKHFKKDIVNPPGIKTCKNFSRHIKDEIHTKFETTPKGE